MIKNVFSEIFVLTANNCPCNSERINHSNRKENKMKDETIKRVAVNSGLSMEEFEKRMNNAVREVRLLQALDETTPILVTKLIEKFRKMTDDEIYEALAEIRCAAEVDEQTKQEYKEQLDMLS